MSKSVLTKNKEVKYEKVNEVNASKSPQLSPTVSKIIFETHSCEGLPKLVGERANKSLIDSKLLVEMSKK